jgi:NAD+ synthetase
MEKINYQISVRNIRQELGNYIQKYHLKALVIGVSGGIDSALCVALAKPVCKSLGIKLIGRSITIESNKLDEVKRSKAIGSNFCTDFRTIDLSDKYLVLRDFIEEEGDETDFKEKIRRGNIKARFRMIYLYNLAQQKNGIVLSTDNYTEYLVGFWTLHGDVGDFGMIQELWKTEVYEMSQWIIENELQSPEEKTALQGCIDAVPTDGLGITSSDLDQLGLATYQEVDIVLNEYMETGINNGNALIKRHLNTIYKRENPFNLKRGAIVQTEKIQL